MSEYWLYRCRNIGFIGVGISGYRNIGFIGVGIFGCRNSGLSGN